MKLMRKVVAHVMDGIRQASNIMQLAAQRIWQSTKALARGAWFKAIRPAVEWVATMMGAQAQVARAIERVEDLGRSVVRLLEVDVSPFLRAAIALALQKLELAVGAAMLRFELQVRAWLDAARRRFRRRPVAQEKPKLRTIEH